MVAPAKVWHWANTPHSTELVQEVYCRGGRAEGLKALLEWGLEISRQTRRRKAIETRIDKAERGA